MTREEIIDFCDMKAQLEPENEDIFKAIIKALEQEPCGDCISITEAIKCLECDFDITGKENMKTVVNYINSAHNKIVNLPSVTPQLSSGLEKNSKKLEKNFGELDCISREQALKELKESAEHHVNDSREEVLLRRDRDIIRALPSVTPQEPTIRNCFGCKYSKDNHNAGIEECHLCMWRNQYTPTIKNDLGVDAISRAEMLRYQEYLHGKMSNEENHKLWEFIKELPSVTPQEPQTFKWCETCKEYDQEKHCCHRFSKVIRDTVDEMKQEQEPILDKIRAEIDNALSDGMVHKKTVLGILDKYKAESEG